MHLTNEQWAVVAPLIPRPVRKDPRGRHRIPDRPVLDGILWVLKTGARWRDLPRREYPPYQTCHRRFQMWTRQKVFQRILTALAHDMETRGKINLKECYIDGSFATAKKGALAWGRPNGARGQRSWRWEMLQVFLSPATWSLLLRMKSRWWRQRLPDDLPGRLRIASWVIGPMTATRSMPRSPDTASK